MSITAIGFLLWCLSTEKGSSAHPVGGIVSKPNATTQTSRESFKR
jgi:hypothetical protein